MPKFKANLDVKISVWQRLDVVFEADNEAHAIQLIKAAEGVPDGVGIDYENTETLFDTEEKLTATDNGGEPVFEINTIQKVS